MRYWVRLTVVVAVAALSVNDGVGQQPGRRRKVFGELTKVEPTAITLTLEKDGKAATFTVNAKTGVQIETDEDEIIKVKGPAGETTMRQPKEKPGKLADLKAGQRVSVVSYDEKAATHIVVKRAKKKEGEK